MAARQNVKRLALRSGHRTSGGFERREAILWRERHQAAQHHGSKRRVRWTRCHLRLRRAQLRESLRARRTVACHVGREDLAHHPNISPCERGRSRRRAVQEDAELREILLLLFRLPAQAVGRSRPCVVFEQELRSSRPISRVIAAWPPTVDVGLSLGRRRRSPRSSMRSVGMGPSTVSRNSATARSYSGVQTPRASFMTRTRGCCMVVRRASTVLPIGWSRTVVPATNGRAFGAGKNRSRYQPTLIPRT